MTVKKAKMVTIMMGIIIGILTLLPVYNYRIQKFGNLSINIKIAIISIMWILGISFVMYISFGIVWSQYIKEKTFENDMNKHINDFIASVRNSNGEKKLILIDPEWDKLTRAIIKHYDPIYMAKIKDNNTVDIIISDRKTGEIIVPEPINFSIKNLLLSFQIYEK